MFPHAAALPHVDSDVFITDGGLETTLIFGHGIDLPANAAFPLVMSTQGRARLEAYFTPFLETARRRGIGFVLDTPTWRANPDWGRIIGYDDARLDDVNRASVAFARHLARRFEAPRTRILVNGVVGPRGDGYQVERQMAPDEAAVYHGPQVRALVEAGADLIGATTMTTAEEAAGIVVAGRAAGAPVSVSFTVETDGRLPSGEGLLDAIDRVDTMTGGAAAFFMINCAHPSHFAPVLDETDPRTARIRGIRANASALSHAELDAAPALDAGDPRDLGLRYRRLRARLPGLTVLGGCCGTDHRHVEAICDACLPVVAV